jgi:hypothetical protein
MTPELKEIEIETLRDELEQYRTAIVSAYKVRKWLECEKIGQSHQERLIDLLEEGEKRRFDGQLTTEYRANQNSFGRIVLKVRAETNSVGASYNDRNPRPKVKRGTMRLETRTNDTQS